MSDVIENDEMPKRDDFSYSTRGEYEFRASLSSWHGRHQLSPIQQQINADAETIKGLQDELEELRQWKRQAIEVMPPYQEIGKLIGVKLGESIHDKILPAIERLTLERDIAEGRNRDHVAAFKRIIDLNRDSLPFAKDIAIAALNNNTSSDK